MKIYLLVVATIVAVALVAPAAQQQGAAGPTAPPGINWPSPPLPDGPIVLDTGIQHQVRLVVTKGLNQPWSMAFLPDGGILVTERPGCLRIIRDGALDPRHVSGAPAVQATGLSGLMDIALHPRFSENHLIYLTYHKPAAARTGANTLAPTGRCGAPTGGGGDNAAAAGRGDNAPPVAANAAPAAPNAPATITLARGRWDGNALVDVQDIFSALPSGNGSRIAFGKDGMVYMTIGFGDIPPPYVNPASAAPQDPNSLAGKVLRLKDDGTVPPDNPFIGRAGYRPEIYTMGHRNMLGLTVHPDTGAIWESENGPNGGDEINVLQPGKNYGWPIVSAGRFYLGPRVNDRMWQEGMEQPLVFWVPAIATSGLTFYTGDRFPTWKGHVFAGGMRQGEVPRSGQLVRLDFNDKWEELHRESMLKELQNRVRDVRQGPDGLLYVLTAEVDGALLRMEPAPPPTRSTP
jgi:aldose sugar dehydrogenase